MTVHRLGIIMHGVTGRMGLNQHLVRSILAIRDQGGVLLANGERVIPDPILVGRNAEKVAALARQFGIERSTADLDGALANPDLPARMVAGAELEPFDHAMLSPMATIANARAWRAAQ